MAVMANMARSSWLLTGCASVRYNVAHCFQQCKEAEKSILTRIFLAETFVVALRIPGDRIHVIQFV